MTRAIAWLVVGMFSACNGQVADSERAPTDSVAVERIVHAIIDADNAGDLSAVLALYADDAVLIPPDGSEVRGIEAIGERYRSAFSRYTMEVAVESQETRVSGDWAFNRGRTRGRLIVKRGEKDVPLDDRYLMILTRSQSGAWQIARLIWN